ncbi:MAG: LysR family transcriptional regulator [Steroidobacteraceae bacterium]
MARLELRRLRNFLAVVEAGSISAAAVRLDIPQPALSRELRLLEESLGCQLLTRHRRGVVATASGEALLRQAADLLRRADSLEQSVRAAAGRVEGQLALGIIPTLAHGLAGRILENFQAQYPNVRIRVEESLSGHLIDMLERGSIDLAITYLAGRLRGMDSRLLLEESLHLVGAVGSSLAGGRGVSLKVALSQPMALPGPDHALRRLVETAARQSGSTLNNVIEVNSLALQMELATRGVAHTVLPLATVAAQLARGELFARPLANPAISRRLAIVVPRSRPLSAACVAMRKTWLETAPAFIRSGNWPGASSLP